MGSWKRELDRKYEELTSLGEIALIDKANMVILEAIEKLGNLKKEAQRKGLME